MAINHEEMNIKVGGDTLSIMIYESYSENYSGEVILTPAYGITARSMFSFAYYLAGNGFKVYCPDYRYHVGKSTGNMEQCKLSTQVEDLLAVIRTTNCKTIVSLSLSVRSTIRACAMLIEQVNLILVTPVVNTAKTVFLASDIDYFGNLAEGLGLPEKELILGNLIESAFVIDAVENNMETTDSTIKDLLDIKGNIVCIAGDNDPWVDYNEVKYVVNEVSKSGKDIKLLTINAAAHKINRNPVVAGKYFEMATGACMNLLGLESNKVIVPNFKEIIRDVGHEKIKKVHSK